MTGGQSLTIHFHRNDDRRERVPLKYYTIADAVEAIQRIFNISDGLYTKAEIYQGNQLIETVENTWSVRTVSILVQ
jgi:hypothetical protein